MPEPTSLDTRRPFKRSVAKAAGFDVRLLRGSGYRRIFNGVYVDASVRATPRLRAQAALVPFGDTAWASHASAARLYGAPIPTIPDEHVGVTRKKDRRNRPGIRSHVNPKPRIRLVDGCRVSECDQMFVELATMLSLVDLVVMGDHLVRAGLITPEALREFCESAALSGAALASRAATYVRRGVDSPMETRLRMLIVLAGLPEPEINLVIRDIDGEPIRKYDLSYPVAKVVIEYDGRLHREREQQWESDLARREDMDDDGWRTLIVTSRGIYRDPHQTLQRIHRLLRARRVPGTPLRLSDEWRPHFPGYGD